MTAEPNRYTWVLTFHGIGQSCRPLEPGEPGVWLDTDAFEKALDLAAERPDVRITFDDGNLSDYDTALPALRARGLSAEIFVSAGKIGQGGYLTPRHLAELADAGMHIGSHGMHHRPWPRLSDRELDEELIDARARLEDIVGSPVARAACPFGAYGRRVLARLRDAGYERVYTSDGGPSAAGAWLQGRTTVLRLHDSSDLIRVISQRPSGSSGLWRRGKLALKRWR